MNYKWITSFLPLSLLVGCNSEAIEITSNTVPKQQIQTIIDNINQRYPNASPELKQNAAGVVVRAIENMVFVEGGTFEMGDFLAPCDIPSKTFNRIDWTPDAECLTSPTSEQTGADILHTVTLSDYSIAKYETSFIDMEWMRQINDLPVAAEDIRTQEIIQRGTDAYKKEISRFSQSAARAKSWQEADNYCRWLGDISQLNIALPTEAQWEFAARSRGKKVYYATNTGYIQYREDNYFVPLEGKYHEYTEAEVNKQTGTEDKIGKYPPNPLGIYGMSNGISEWVNDWYSNSYYEHSEANNPTGPKTGNKKVLRDAMGTTFTFSRLSDPLNNGRYYFSVSFRCSIQ
jgi:formylglycine-generating enzyme